MDFISALAITSGSEFSRVGVVKSNNKNDIKSLRFSYRS